MLALSAVLAVAAESAGAFAAEPRHGYLGELIGHARTLRLSEQPQWLSLGHYRPAHLRGGHRSLIDSEGFFNAGGGKRDPSAELEATLAAFFAPAGSGGDDQHPQCAFIARYRWLKHELGFDPLRLPERPCPRFEGWRAAIAPMQVTLVAPVAYLNNPSSMFGHTLLRLDRTGQDAQTRLLSYAVNFGAEVGDDGGLLFAIKGLAGGYRGSYSILPYYQLVRRYSDFENRDIWEYQLGLTEDEIGRLMEHLWELRPHHSDYYFFDENCSYQLLFLLDVARPGLRLVNAFPLHAIPVDTVRAVVASEDLVRTTAFHPSSRTLIEHRLRSLSADEQALVEDLSQARLQPHEARLLGLQPRRKAAVLELAADFVTYEIRTGARSRERGAALAWQLLAARSALPVGPELPDIEPPARPDQGHGSARIAAGIGSREGRLFQSLRLRPAYHALADPPAGFVEGAEINFLDLELRHFEGKGGLALESLALAEIRSFAPRSYLIRPISWQLGGGIERFRVERGDEVGELVGALSGGAGPSFALGERAMLTLLGEAKVAIGHDCFRTCFAALGPVVSVLWGPSEQWTVLLEGREQLLLSERITDRYEVRATSSLALGHNLALRLELLAEDDGAGAELEWSSSLHWYF